MSSTSVTQHTSQPLNFGPEWLRALSTPDSATSNPSSSGSGNVFKFSAIKYRYSKDEILALRVNVAERLAENLQNEIMNNLKDVENVFRADILDPLALTPPTAEETAKMNALSSYISGRTPGGAGRPGNNSQQSQSDSRINRPGSSISNNRGSNSRGRGGRDNNFGSTRGNNNNNNNNSDDNGENGNVADDTSSWSRNNHHSRGGGGGNAFGNRVRSFDDREQSQTFRRGAGRQTSDGWRRSRGDDDEHPTGEQGEDLSTSVNGSSSWTSSRNGPARRVNSNGSMDQRTKSNDKWSQNDERSGSTSSGGWRTNSSTSDRDFNTRRPQVTKHEQMPEWMDDDNNDDDNQLNNATFEQDGTFTRSTSIRPNDNEDKPKTQSTSEESPVDIKRIVQDESKSEQLIPQTEPTVVNTVQIAAEPLGTTTQSKPVIPSWDDDFGHHDLATTIVESTLADDHDYSPPVSIHPTPCHMSVEPSTPIIPPVVIDDKQWFYKDPQNTIQGPFSSADMERWFNAGYFTVNLPVKRHGENHFSTIRQLMDEIGPLPFRTDQKSQKVNPTSNYSSSSSSSNAFIDDYLMQQNSQQQTYPFNRQTSMPIADRKPHSTSQLQNYFSSQTSSNSINDSSSIVYPQMHRSLSSTNNQYDYTRLVNPNSSYFQQSNDLLTRLQHAEQIRQKDQIRHDYEFDRLKYYEQTRLQREQEEKRKFQLQQEFAMNRQSNLDQLSKAMDMESLVTYQKANIEAQQAEAIRRYQQHYGEQSMANNWNRSNSSFLDSQDQDRTTAFAHQYANTESLTNCSPLSFSLNNKTNTWSQNFSSYENNSQIQTINTLKSQIEYVPTSHWNNQPSMSTNEKLDEFTRTQDLLIKWTEYQFKDNLKDIDVATLIQLLKDIDNSNEIIEYVRPYMGCISKAKEFADNFLLKRNQFSKLESNVDYEQLNDLFDDFQLATSHTHKKKSKKLKGLKLDGKQLNFTVNNAPEQRDDIDQIPM